MEVLKDNLEEIEIGSSVESFQKFLRTQSDLFHSQTDQLQRIVVTQCKLTGVNPLSQEMAAGALSINIGKKPRDLLNPKAVKHMQEVFSIKDAISKKESREISAQFSITVSQVREYFPSQRSRVRKIVRLSHEKAIRCIADKEADEGILTISDSDHVMPIDPVPLSSVGPAPTEEIPSCAPQDDTPAGLNSSDKRFTDNIFNLLRKEETFSGQVKAMEWILQIKTPSVMEWFLTKGGLMILATWLTEAAVEEQTSVLLVSLNVLCHLPLHKALPEHMSAILHSVNTLRFYRTSDISNRARVLLAKWSKMFARIQAMKKPNGLKSSADMQTEILLNQSIDEIMGDGLWQTNMDGQKNTLALPYGSSENSRIMESSQGLKLLTASTDESSRKHILGVPTSHSRQRRKVQMVEQPGQKMSGRSPQVTRVVPLIKGRPMSTDDIQKAKLRALHMQSKYGKAIASANESNGGNNGDLKDTPNIQTDNVSPIKRNLVPSKTEEQEITKSSPDISDKPALPVVDSKLKTDLKGKSSEKGARVQIAWQAPPEIKLDDLWRVCAGENSKEVDGQRNRNRREMEITYRSFQEIPSNPKGPWDLEMDYDDSLTPEIPIEQIPEVDITETEVTQSQHIQNTVVAAPSVFQTGSEVSRTLEPDLELLAVLLKNPELVFALTSGQSGNMSNEDTVKLLDLLKKGRAGLPENGNGIGGREEEKIEVSLPSPTPSSNTRMNSWRSEEITNPYLQQNTQGSRALYPSLSSVAKTAPIAQVSAPSLVHSRVHDMGLDQQAQTIMPSTSVFHEQQFHRAVAGPSSSYSSYQSQPQYPYTSNHAHLANLGSGSGSESWRGGMHSSIAYSNSFSQVNRTSNHNELYGRQQVGQPSAATQYGAPRDGYESWSPESARLRTQEYNSAAQQQTTDSNWNSNVDDGSRGRQQGYPNYGGYDRLPDGRWRERR